MCLSWLALTWGGKVSRVCRDWYRLSSDDAIWRRFVKESDAEAEVADHKESGML
jgi:hypothetical protein